MPDREQAVQELRDNLRANLLTSVRQISPTDTIRTIWEAAGLDFEEYRNLGDRQILLHYLLACHDVDPQEALHEVATLPMTEANIRQRTALAEIQLQCGHWAKTGRLRSAA